MLWPQEHPKNILFYWRVVRRRRGGGLAGWGASRFSMGKKRNGQGRIGMEGAELEGGAQLSSLRWGIGTLFCLALATSRRGMEGLEGEEGGERRCVCGPGTSGPNPLCRCAPSLISHSLHPFL